MLDQQQGVAQVAKFLQGVEQPGVVAGVQADRRFVEHVEHAAQPAAHLRRQADSLHFAAGERGRRPGEREVVEPHVDQELRAIADLAVDFAGDLPLGGRRLPGEEVGQHLAQRLAADLVDRAAAETHGGRVVAQSAAAADRAIDLVDEVFQAAAETGGNAAGFFQGRVETFELEAEGWSGTSRSLRGPLPTCHADGERGPTSNHCSPVPCMISRRCLPPS